jgi:glutaminase
MNYQNIINEIKYEIEPFFNEGNIANYIPALAKIDPRQFAMSIKLIDGTSYNVGNTKTKFSIQSISKVFTFTLALQLYGKKLYKRVGHEPSGDPFNSLVQLEYENGIPRNPFINAGAIVTTDSLLSKYHDESFDYILDFIRTAANDFTIGYDNEVYTSELAHGYMNVALVNMMKSYKNINNNISDVIQTYFKQCSIEMNTEQLASSMLFLANHGINPITNKALINESKSKRINSLMLTCGHYDASGDFAFNVGLPGKSGVGGGIVAVVPKVMGISVWAPGLNAQGNSLVGTMALELFTSKTCLSVF